jgi:hypothetical protein
MPVLVTVESPLSEQHRYPNAGPVIRHALAAAAHLSATQHQLRIQDLYRGKCDGLAHALEIMLNAADTQVAPGIAGKDQLPAGAVEQTRRLVGRDRADWLLGNGIR